MDWSRVLSAKQIVLREASGPGCCFLPGAGRLRKLMRHSSTIRDRVKEPEVHLCLLMARPAWDLGHAA